MSWKPAFEIGLGNAWLFMIIYPLQWLAVLILPTGIGERTAHAREIIQGRRDRIMAWLTQGFWIGATLYSIFLPLRTGSAWFWIGLALFAAGLTALLLASFRVAATPPGRPFTSGIYRFSRHPMYLSMILVYAAVSIAALSWLFALITVATFFLQRYQMIQEEGYCCGKFGQPYRDYMRITPRWLGFPSD
ncbi:MAG: isoprenylcysteine carboxylmethyltransferase family protein [Candidatus Aminicenantes bacterium]|nr:isoprenylcysteine carboxylmethyltransferase family protein [Candidatus Aminicenantes bacterium]